MQIQVLFIKMNILSFAYDLEVNQTKHMEIKKYKKNKLVNIYTLKDIVLKIKSLFHTWILISLN